MLKFEYAVEKPRKDVDVTADYRSIDRIPIGAPSLERAIDIVRNIDDLIFENITDKDYSAFIESAWRSARGPSRWIITARNAKEMRQSLAEFSLKGRCSASGTRHTAMRYIAFVFSGMGPQWGGMGRELAANLPRFAEHIEKIDKLFIEYQGYSVWDELEKHKQAKQLPTDLAQTGNFLLQAALYDLLVDENIIPNAIIGHSAGEVAAAYAAGVYTLDEAVQVAIARGSLQASLSGRGSMLAVGLSREEAVKMLADIHGVSIAAINDENGVTLSGDSDEIASIDAMLQQKNIFSKILRVEVPYHSPVMDEITHEITEKLSFLSPRKSRIKLYSTVIGEETDGPEWDGNYWACNIRQPVLFADTLKLALSEGYNCFIEIAPHPVLSQSINSLSSDIPGISIQHLISRRDNEYESFISRVSELAIDGVGRPPKRVSAPLLRTVHDPHPLWDEDPESEAARRGLLAAKDVPLLGRRKTGTSTVFEVEISTTDYPWIAGHDVQDLGAIVPATLWAELISLAASEGDIQQIVLTDLRIIQSLPVSDHPVLVSTKIEAGVVKCLSRPIGKSTGWTLHAIATVSSLNGSQALIENIKDQGIFEPPAGGVCIDRETLYQAFRLKGLNYEGHFKNLVDIVIGDQSDAWATIDGITPFKEGRHSPWVLDAGLQLLIAAARDWGENMYLPFRIGRINLFQTLIDAQAYQAHARIEAKTESELIGSVRYYDQSGYLLAELEEIVCIRNFSDDAERLNYIDRNTYALRDLSPEEIADRFYNDDDEALEMADDVQREEFWLANEHTSLPFDRPCIDFNTLDKDSVINLLWVLPNDELQSDILATTRFLQKVGSLNNRTITLTLIANRAQSWLSGMRRTAANAYSCNIRAIFIDEDTSTDMLEAVVALTDEQEIVFDADEPLFRRLETVTGTQLRELDIPNDEDSSINGIPASTLSFGFPRGQPNKLIALNEPLRGLKDGEVCVEVDTSSLTWKDIGKILGTIGTNVVHTFTSYDTGSGVTGVVVATGTGSPYSVGDRVYGPIRRAYRKHIIFNVAEARLLRKMPEGLSSAVLATHMVPWMTVFTIFENAAPKPGEKVFIQSGAGGAGSVICLYAKRLGAKVVTSVGTEDKVDEVKKILPDVDVVVARGDGIPDALARAGHKGFDWIIATVSGATRVRLLSRLNLLGKYVDIGKPVTVEESLPAAAFDGNKHYFVMDIDQLFLRKEGWLESQLDRALEVVKDPANHVPVTRYSIDQLPEAVTAMGRGETSGCIAITFPQDYNPPALNTPNTQMDPDGSYLITGGYGAVGLIAAQWLSSRGARHIVLSGSSGKPNKTSQAAIDLLKAGGVEIQVVKNDASDSQSVMDMLRNLADSGRKIRGVIHAAGMIADGQFKDIDSNQIAKSIGPKLEGAHYLVEALDAVDALYDLQFLLFTSSVSSAVGILIQGTYGAANAGLDGLAEELRSIGINATAMQLGPIDSGGMASDDAIHRYLSTIGLGYVTPRRLCGILDLAVAANAPHFVTEEIDWAKNGRGLTANISSSLLRHIVRKAMSGTGQADLESLLALDHDGRSDVLSKTLKDIISSALGMEESHLSDDSNFSSMGVDSLAIMEVQAGVNEALQVDVPLARLFTQDGTIGLLAAQISEYLEANYKTAEESA